MKDIIKIGFGISFGVGLGMIATEYVKAANITLCKKVIKWCDNFLEKHDDLIENDSEA